MRVTLGYALPLLARYAGNGLCADDPRVIDAINMARERLMKKRNRWKGMVQRYTFQLYNSCLTLPREIQTIEGALMCGRIPIKNQWYEIMESGPGKVTAGSGCLNILHDRGDGWATFADLCGPAKIRIYTDVAESSASRVLIKGFDENGNRVRTMDNGTYIDGEYLTPITGEAVDTTHTFSSVDGIQKSITNGFIRVYAFVPSIPEGDPTFSTTSTTGATTISEVDWGLITGPVSFSIERTETGIQVFGLSPYGDDGQYVNGDFPLTVNLPAGGPTEFSFVVSASSAAAHDEYDNITITRVPGTPFVPSRTYPLSILHPDDTLPSYRRYLVPGVSDSHQLTIIAILRYLPVRNLDDYLIIENMGALQNMLLALKYEAEGVGATAAYHEQKAEDILQQELESYMGVSAVGSVSVQVEAFSAGDIACIL